MAPPRVRRKSPRKKTAKRTAVRMLSHAQVPAAVERLAAPSGTARFAAGKALAVTAAKAPERVYPHWDTVAGLLTSDSKVVRWNALQIIASLACADTQHKLDALLETYLGFIRGGNLISAANAIQGAGRIARARPDLVDRIVAAILGVEDAAYETPECRNVALGHALGVLDELGPSVCRRSDVAAFIRRQATNSRAAVARCAERMVTELAAGG